MAAISFTGVSKRIGSRAILSGVDLEIPAGALAALVGPSGAGKTLLLRMIAGLEHPDEGVVRVAGRPVGESGRSPRGVAMVFEDDALYEHLDVGGNLRFPLETGGATSGRVEEVSRASARRTGITRLWRHRPRTLSRGERGMAAAARAISREDLKVLLLDEPLSGADRSLRQRLRHELRRLHAAHGLTTVVATNDHEEAMALGDLMAVVMHGRIAQVGPPRSVFDAPASAAVASFVGSPPMNLFPGEIGYGDGTAFVLVAGSRLALGRSPALPQGARVVMGVHPHEIGLAPPGTPRGSVLQGTVSRVEDLGTSVHVLFGLGRSAAGTFVMTESRPGGWRPGDRLELTWSSAKTRLFEADSGRAVS